MHRHFQAGDGRAVMEVIALVVSQHPLLFAALIVAAMFAYSKAEYYRGRVDGLNDGEAICKKHHPEAWKKGA